MRKSLPELRKEWEKGMIIRLAVCHCKTVIVLLEDNNRFHIHRYFPIGINSKNWEISVDYSTDNFNKALLKINEWFRPDITQLMQNS